MKHTKRINILPGQIVSIVMKQDQRSGARTEGVVKNILTKSSQHPHGIKVKLETGEVGRVQEILEEPLDDLILDDFPEENSPDDF